MKRVYVWTLPTRLFHWLFVSLIVGSWIASEENRWLSPHVAMGYAVGVLVVFRIVWGIMGPQYSRFGDFNLRVGPLKEYLLSILHPTRHYIGHNPAASFVMVAMLITVVLVVLSGMLTYGIQENRGLLAFLHDDYFHNMKVFKEVHEFFVNLLLVLIASHVGGVLVDRFLHKADGTLTSIIDGHKNMEGEDAVLSLLQKIIATLGIGGAIALLIYALSVQNNPITVGYNKKIDYANENPVFVKECGSCHTLYPPALLPKESWKKLMGDLPNHFGDDASLEPSDHQTILAYLLEHSAETSTQEMSVKMMKSLDKPDIIAITQTPFWKRTHREIPEDIFKSDKVKSRANCKACHSDVEQGTIEDNAIKAL
ncbi:MAG: cytochrome b/b6 domain-containing protein [Sulfuricurvum sp.]|uniref:cytochrome b/b6 domain-containing protein n=1 Tax=Sulfuricurvum sp. TaxID=2025608 RepID=UPI00260923EE|nr:cytochrome b/b6 domain-containing protein [Sulfuricurvum sp.]MDD2829911.1 cytochrome b/b6 domain-containing protein [Sulfuricurvum sp.]MDD4949599.1 cytochrome b/b6 domain-containing protein [Sulfuricurvum sp.]